MKTNGRDWQRTLWGAGAIGLSLIALTVALLAAFSGQTEPVPASDDTFVPDTLVPDSADAVGEVFRYSDLMARHFSHHVQPPAEPGTTRWRMGVGIPAVGPLAFDWPEQRPGWYLSWAIYPSEIGDWRSSAEESDLDPLTIRLLGMEFVPMVRMWAGELRWPTEVVTQIAANNPGFTWLIGNEPDVQWQDNTTPEAFAAAYHEAYSAIKKGDPTALVAIGSVSQITPLRLDYLDRVRAAYEAEHGMPIPVDVWTMHAYVLREERDSWGVGIPPGMEDVDAGVLWDIEEHDDLRLVENQIRLMRSWMAHNGEDDKPLWITEYGILLPKEYGFTTEQVEAYMLDSFDLFDTLRHDELGLAEDEGRLVQRWAWFSTYFRLYPTSDLFDDDGLPTPLMDSMSDYLDASR